MTRIPLTDGSGRWFDKDKAHYIKESSTHDGRNYISDATGSQWEHEGLYRTIGKVWVLNHWSNWQGSRETYEIISDSEAAIWLAKQGLDPHESIENEYNNLEIK